VDSSVAKKDRMTLVIIEMTGSVEYRSSLHLRIKVTEIL
jgi:hypothetical protein